VDSHLALPDIAASDEALEAVELVPFRRALAAGCPAILVAHARYPSLDPEWPASLSPAIIRGLLRGRLAFGGLVVSDDLEMDAVARGWGVAEATVRFLAAGGDLAIVSRHAAARQAAAEAVGAALASGQVSGSDAVARRGRLRRGQPVAVPPLSVIGCAEHRDLAEEVGQRGFR
jgi:beta-N-acetylhexosaminidase